MMPTKTTSAPAAEPCTAAEAKLASRFTAGGLDSLITDAYIPAARQACEHRTGRSLITQTVVQTAGEWPGDEIELVRAPVQSVAHVKYRDSDGTLQTVSASWYELIIDSDTTPPVIALKPGYSWPTAGDYEDAIQITYVAGYGNAAADVPADLRAWVIAAAGEMIRTGSLDIPRDFCGGLLDRATIQSI
jgi:uncharacterized phiE125 gp8 family phage protein